MSFGPFNVSKLWVCSPAKRRVAPARGRRHATVRDVSVIGPNSKVKLVLTNPMTIHRSFEGLSVIDAILLTAQHGVASLAIDPQPK